jgi:hypothetical protein
MSAPETSVQVRTRPTLVDVIKPCGFQLAQMLQKRRQRHVVRGRQLSHAGRTEAQLLDDVRRVGSLSARKRASILFFVLSHHPTG